MGSALIVPCGATVPLIISKSTNLLRSEIVHTEEDPHRRYRKRNGNAGPRGCECNIYSQ